MSSKPRTSLRTSRASRASRLRRKTLTTTPYKPPNQIKGIFAGSGLLLNIPCMAEQLVKLSGKAKEDCIVLYLGTASYDIELKTKNQTSWYEKNCKQLIVLDVVANAPKTSYMRYVYIYINISNDRYVICYVMFMLRCVVSLDYQSLTDSLFLFFLFFFLLFVVCHIMRIIP